MTKLEIIETGVINEEKGLGYRIMAFTTKKITKVFPKIVTEESFHVEISRQVPYIGNKPHEIKFDTEWMGGD